MAKVTVIATGKKYGTRHMTAGEELSVKPMEARVLKALGVAKDPPAAEPKKPKPSHERQGTAFDSGATGHERQGRDATPLHPLDGDRNGAPGGSMPADQRGDDLTALRDAYEGVFGSPPDMRWGAARLRGEIAKGKPSGDGERATE